jgi:hypothetical protein
MAKEKAPSAEKVAKAVEEGVSTFRRHVPGDSAL